MNQVAEEMLYLMHYGMPRRSGRYPWGSGEDPYQHNRDFMSRVEELKKQGWTETAENIKKEFGLTTKEYRMEKAIAKDQRRIDEVARAKSLAADGLGPTEIGRIMGKNESSVRELLDPKREERMLQTRNTVDILKKSVDEKGMIDVGSGVDLELQISKERLDLALYYLEKEGYPVYKGGIPQPTNPGQQTNQRVLCVPGTPYKEIYNYEKIGTINDYISRDGGMTYEKKFTYPASMDSKRLMIRYNEDGGIDKDGVVELRRGVDDLSLGESRYSQVRILVDGTHYIKGMAVYSDNMPDGVDVIFNTNKTKGTPMTKVLKEIKNDPDNPFGSLIKDADQGGQYWYTDKQTGEKKLGLINKRADEGDWTEWKDSLPSQFLGKQSLHMVNKQLNLAKADKLDEFDVISSLENPTLKKHFLKKFADECDSAAVHLQAAALPGQKYHVIIPINTLKDNEIYAPGYEPGTKLALVRYPHGGTFEIPILTVTNKNKDAVDIIGPTSIDAVGINKKVADRLSGADFDGDTVMCIPTHDAKGNVKITSTDPNSHPAFKELQSFDPKLSYPERKGMKYMKDPVTGVDNTQKEMGVISNLITDMTLAGASPDKLVRAVKHSMVVIDAGKHKLDYKQSEKENNIDALKKEFQKKPTFDKYGNQEYGGAATILSRSKGEYTVDKRQGTPKINVKGSKDYDPTRPEGALIYKDADDLYYVDRKYDKKTGNVILRTDDGKKITYNTSNASDVDYYKPVKKVNKETGDVIFTNKTGDITYKSRTRTQKSTNMAETDDAMTLVSTGRHPTELAYANYANSMKALANQARMEMVRTGSLKYDPSAKATYQKEYDSLMKKLNEAELNKTRERAALRKANADVKNKKTIREESDDPMSKSEIKKANQQAVTKYRQEVGSKTRKERNIEITDREWEAIQAGAITESKLIRILNNTDTAALRERATPRSTTTLSPARINKIKSMSDSNYSLAEIAAACGCSTTTVSKYLKGGT